MTDERFKLAHEAIQAIVNTVLYSMAGEPNEEDAQDSTPSDGYEQLERELSSARHERDAALAEVERLESHVIRFERAAEHMFDAIPGTGDLDNLLRTTASTVTFAAQCWRWQELRGAYRWQPTPAATPEPT